MTTYTQVLAAARSQLGTRESPSGSNRTKYGVWYGWNGVPWCAQYVSWCFNQAGGLTLIGGKSASVAVIASRMRAKGRYGSAPRVGALAIFNGYSHIELVTGVGPATVSTIGGNTSDWGGGSVSNGGGVFANTRRRSLIRGYAYPAYATAVSRSTTRTPIRLVVNGVFDTATRKAFQRWAGVTVDGSLGPLSWRAIQRKVGATADGAPGPQTWKAIQRLVGATQDGAPGKQTYAAIQRFLNTH